MMDIHDRIKLAIWDLDGTLWDGILAEGDDVVLRPEAARLVRSLPERGIPCAICSRNDEAAALAKLEELGLRDRFAAWSVSFGAKGPAVADLICRLRLRPCNVLFVDDDPVNLAEAARACPGLNTAGADDVPAIGGLPELQGGPDPDLVRHREYAALSARSEAMSAAASDLEFLRDLDIRVRFAKASAANIDRIHELSERSNQLNFTKDRQDRGALLHLARSDNVEMACLRVMDKFGDSGIAGFYALCRGRLIHFVFSCRILGLGVEQWLWERLGYPDLEIRGDVAVRLDRNAAPIDYIAVDEDEDEASDAASSVDAYVKDEDRLDIIGIGACDLFRPVSGVAMHGAYLRYECNVFRGDERSVNTGTEYLRSCFDMDPGQKAFCRARFRNYGGSLAFATELGSGRFGCAILSFHDDIAYDIFVHRKDPGLRVVRTDDPACGATSVLEPLPDGRARILPPEEAKAWMDAEFLPGRRISRERFLDNLAFLMDACGPDMRFVLMGAPEIGFYRDWKPADEAVFAQARMINGAIREFAAAHAGRCAAVDVASVVRSREDVGDYMFHFNPRARWGVTIAILRAMAGLGMPVGKPLLSGLPVRGRKIAIVGAVCAPAGWSCLDAAPAAIFPSWLKIDICSTPPL